MANTPEKPEGIRERKRRETLRRIAETGLKLFVENGYDATTLDTIAAASGISARTFFYYFRTKDEVLLFWQGDGFLDALRSTLLQESPEQAPLDAVRNCLLKLTSLYETDQSLVVDRVMQSSEALRTRKQARFVQMEENVFTALCELWPQCERHSALRMVAMVSIGAMRLAMQIWRQHGESRPLADYLRESFAILENQIQPSRA